MTYRNDTPAMNVISHLLLLPADPTGAAIHLQVDTGGRVLARSTVTSAASLAIVPTQPPTRQVLAVPGTDCLALWLELPARNPAQALAAARLLIEDHVASVREPLHIAIAPLPPGAEKRLLVAVESARMQDWLDRAAALGMTPDAVVPAPLLLPAPTTDAPDAVTIAHHDGHWLICGEHLAFAAEPSLAEQVIGTRPRLLLPDADIALAMGARTPPINLLQYQFAPTPSRREGWPAYRRAAVLAGLLALSPLLVLAAQALRYELGARSLESRAAQQARAVVPAIGEDDDPLPPIRARLTELRAADAFTRRATALFTAIEAIDGTELDALTYAGGELQATVAHGDATKLDRLRAALAETGLELVETGSRVANGRTHSTINVRPAE